MDYEKAYKEALERAKNIDSLNREYITPKEAIEYLFPQLKESEDEKIRKWIYNYIERVGKTWGKQPITYTQILAWLEKQKPLEWGEEDETALQDALWCIEQARKQAKDENDMGTCWFAERWLKSLKPQNHWKPTQAMVDALKWAICEFHPDCPETRDALEKLYCEINHL